MPEPAVPDRGRRTVAYVPCRDDAAQRTAAWVMIQLHTPAGREHRSRRSRLLRVAPPTGHTQPTTRLCGRPPRRPAKGREEPG